MNTHRGFIPTVGLCWNRVLEPSGGRVVLRQRCVGVVLQAEGCDV